MFVVWLTSQIRGTVAIRCCQLFPLLSTTTLHILYQEVWKTRVQSVQASKNGKETFEKLKFLPDPKMQEDGHYLPFQEPFALNTTTEQDRPSQKGKRKASPLSFSPRVQHAQNTDIMFQCDECSMWHLLFLSVSYQLQSVLLYR